MTATTAVGTGDWSEHVGLVFSRLNEQQRRWVGGLLSDMLGRGGTKQIAELAELDPKTIRQGRIDLERRLEDYPDDGRVRRPGGGRPPLKKKDSTIEQDLKELVEPETGGDPEGHAKYTRSSLRSLARRLGRASAKTVGRLLKGMDYSLRTNVKRLAGKPHPHRDRQYRFIQRVKALFRRHGDPVISVDAKKNELVGNFKNAGECWCVAPEEVNMYDFPSDADGKATPYGIYDQVANHAYVVIGISVITAAFAVACIRRWWETYGHERYPDSQHIMIECDGGGCNGHRVRLWKHELQQLADDTGLSVTVCHYPSGASKWNPIEHRVFSQISSNWAGYPLRSLRRIIGFIRGTTTETGLIVDAEVDPRTYEKGIKISDKEMRTRNLKRRRFCSNLNYTIRPRQSGNS